MTGTLHFQGHRVHIQKSLELVGEGDNAFHTQLQGVASGEDLISYHASARIIE